MGCNHFSPAIPDRSSPTEPNAPGSNRIPTATEIATTLYVVADPDLAAVVAAWPELPEVIRAGILAMVNSVPLAES
jgi:hypothetical protein